MRLIFCRSECKLEKSPHQRMLWQWVEEWYPFFTILLSHKFVIQDAELKSAFPAFDFWKFRVGFLIQIWVIRTLVTASVLLPLILT